MNARLRAPKLEGLFVATFVLLGFRLGVRPIGDNSMFTHLRTGIDMVRAGSIPRTDPYSFTAEGSRWVVQSWLPEWTYGWAHQLGGYRLVVLEQAVLVAALAWLVVRLARTGSPLRTAAAGLLTVGIGAPFWSPRPLLFGLVCMALTVTVVERKRTPWLLVPIVWLWVSSHGSFRSAWSGSEPGRWGRRSSGGRGRGTRCATSGGSPPAWSSPSSTRWAAGCWRSRSPWATAGKRSRTSWNGRRPTSRTVPSSSSFWP